MKANKRTCVFIFPPKYLDLFYFHRITAFQKKTDALNISLVLDISGIEDKYKGPGYHHPEKEVETPTGIDSFPAVFSFPGVGKNLSTFSTLILCFSSQSLLCLN